MVLWWGQAIYPVLIIVIVALKLSPLEQGFADSIHITDFSTGRRISPIHFGSFDIATVNTVEMTGTTRSVDRDGASEASSKRVSVDIRKGTDEI